MNLFNPLTGDEAKKAILNEVARALDNDSEFRPHLTFPRVSWHWTLEMKIYPRTPEEKTVEASGEAVQMQTTGVADDAGRFTLARDKDGRLMPVVAEDAPHTREVLHSTPRETMAPDAIRAAEALTQNTAAPGGIRVARHAEVGKASEAPLLSPGLNRG